MLTIVAIIVALAIVVIVELKPQKRLTQSSAVTYTVNADSLKKAISMELLNGPWSCPSGPLPSSPTIMRSNLGYDIAPCLGSYFAKLPVNPSRGYYNASNDYNTYYTVAFDRSTREISIQKPFAVLSSLVPTGATSPRSITTLGQYVYAGNLSGTGSVVLVNGASGTAITNLDTYGVNTKNFTTYLSKVYIANGGGSTISVITGTTQGSVSTIPAGTTPKEILNLGTKIYVANAGGGSPCSTMSVINAMTDTYESTVTFTPPGGCVWPWFAPTMLRAIAPKIYIGGTGYVYSVNTATGNSYTPIAMPGAIVDGMATSGTKVYVVSANIGKLFVINSLTDTITATIDIPTYTGYDFTGGGITVLNSKVYLANSGGSTISVIDTASDTITGTINVGNNPRYFAILDQRVYVANRTDKSISIIDTTDNNSVINVGLAYEPLEMVFFGQKLYITLYGGSYLGLVDIIQ